MDHIKILKRAWTILWNYKALWVFGIILALTTGSNSGNTSRFSFNNQDRPFDYPPFGEQVPPLVWGTIINIAIVALCVLCVLVILSIIARYVSETALIKAVNLYEETGDKVNVWQGFRLGWSRTAFNLFLIRLVTGLPAFLIFMVLFVIGLAPLLLWFTKSTALGVIGSITAVGLFFLVIILAIIVGVVLTFLNRFFMRACAIEGLGIADSFRRGFELVKAYIKDVGIMWLIMVGIRIAIWTFMVPLVFILIGVGAIFGGLPALSAGGIASLLFSGEAAPYIAGILVGFPIFCLTLLIPLGFLGGLKEVFISTTWTLTYRELLAFENLRLPESGGLEEISPR